MLRTGSFDIQNTISKYGVVIAFVTVFTLLSILSDYFFTQANLLNLTRQISFNTIIATGMTFVILTGGIDLSVGSVVGLAGVITGSLLSTDMLDLPIFFAICIGVAAGALIGLINGLLLTFGKAAPFIVTMGTMTIMRGLAMVYSDGKNIINLTDKFEQIVSGHIGVIPVPVVVMVVVLVLGWILLNNYSFGRHVKAVGGNEAAAIAAGLNVKRIKVLVYMLSGALSAVASILLIARLNVAQPILGEGYELDAIAATVIGGTSLSGGVGTIWGLVVGSLLIGCITNGLDLLNVSAYYQQVAKGLIILIAVLIDRRGK